MIVNMSMSVIERKTYAEFLHPDRVHLGQVEHSLREVDMDNRDARCLPGPPSDAVGVRFFDQIEVEVIDNSGLPSTELIVCKSPRLNVSPGVIFYEGALLAENNVRARANLSDVLKNTILANMRNNGWEHVIFVKGIVLPFDKNVDSFI
jgi:hypothetical protein